MAGPLASPSPDGNQMLAWRESFPLEKEKWRLVGFCILCEPGPPCLLAQPPGWSAPPGNRAPKKGLAKFAAFCTLETCRGPVAGRFNFKGGGLGVRGRCGPAVGSGDRRAACLRSLGTAEPPGVAGPLLSQHRMAS